MINGEPPSWRSVFATMASVFLIAAIGCSVALVLWLRDISEPQIAILGSGNRLSLLVMDGPARLLIASGDDPIGFENALTSVLPLFARRLDLLLITGHDKTLLAPLAAHDDGHVRSEYAMAPLPGSPNATAFGPLPDLESPRRVRLGPDITVTIETVLPFGADPAASPASWRATVERGGSRVVVLSDGSAAGLLPPQPRAAVLVIAGDDPQTAWAAESAVAIVANAGAIAGPDLRAAFSAASHPPRWTYRVASGEALRLRFTANGLELPAEPAQPVGATPEITLANPPISRRLRSVMRRA